MKVEVYAERLTKLCNNIAKITEAELVYVALGEDKKPITLKSPAPGLRSAVLLRREILFLFLNRGGNFFLFKLLFSVCG